ncbi:MAG: hypothetical protein KDA61_09915 [Planctomycetales bacterium]|nr:hypothetical protein [Planctomycetales bacterium]
MTISDLVVELRRRGVDLKVTGGRLLAPAGSQIVEALLVEIKHHKASLIKIFEADDMYATMRWLEAVDILAEDPEFPSEAIDDMREATARWETEVAPSDSTTADQGATGDALSGARTVMPRLSLPVEEGGGVDAQSPY